MLHFKWVFDYISRHTGKFNCLLVQIVSSGGTKICSRNIGKITSLALFAVVSYHRKYLIWTLWCLITNAMDNILEILTFSHKTENRTSSICISKMEDDFGSY